MNTVTREQQRIEAASALKRLLVRRCLKEISPAEFERARAAIMAAWLDHCPAEAVSGLAPPHPGPRHGQVTPRLSS